MTTHHSIVQSFIACAFFGGCVAGSDDGETAAPVAVVTQSAVSSVAEVVVTAKTLADVRYPGQYVVDLATRGTIYTTDPSAGPIAYDRIVVRTDDLTESFLPWVQKSAAALRIDPATDLISAGNTDDYRELWPWTGRTATDFTCNPSYCDCSGMEDCRDMLHTGCSGWHLWCTRRGGGPIRCLCDRGGLY